MRPLPRLPPDIFKSVAQYLDVEDVAKVRQAVPQASRYPASEQFVHNTEDPSTLLDYYRHTGDATAVVRAFDMYLLAPHVFGLPPADVWEQFAEYALEKAGGDAGLEDVLNYYYLMPEELLRDSNNDTLWEALTDFWTDLHAELFMDDPDDEDDYDFYVDTYVPYASKRMDRDFQAMSIAELVRYPVIFLRSLSPDALYTLLERFSDEEVLMIFWSNYQRAGRRAGRQGIDHLDVLQEQVDAEHIERFDHLVQTLKDFKRSRRRHV